MPIGTKNISDKVSGGFTPKNLQPGNVSCKIEGIYLEKSRFNDQEFNLTLNLEGPDMGEDFTGFMIDKDDPSRGTYRGQIARVRASEYTYKDGTTPSGVAVSRDNDILRMVGFICKETDSSKWLEAQHEKHDTVEELIEQLNTDKPFKDKYLRFCLAGREYDKNGYTNYDLFLPKFTKTSVPFESETKEEASSKVAKFDPSIHIKKRKTATVDSFNETPETGAKKSPAAQADEFDL